MLAVLLTLGGEAAACVYLPLFPAGTSQAEQEAHHRRVSAEQVRTGGERARRAWAEGIDAAAELADMLVPNIRPIPIERSSCGPINELDVAEGEETIEDWLVGTRFAGRGKDFPEIRRLYDGETLGPTCNAELRGRFAAYLRQRLGPKALRDSYLFLAARRPDWDGNFVPLRRLVTFDGRTRTPPVRWFAGDQWQQKQIHRWTRRDRSGRALQAAMDDFWRETAPLLADNRLVCPTAGAAWAADQARIVEMIEARLARRRAAAGIKPKL